MKKGMIIATTALSLGIVAPLVSGQINVPNLNIAQAQSSNKYSYITTGSNKIEVTNIRKGAKISLVNNFGQVIATKKTNQAGTVKFNLTDNQADQLTNTNSLAVTLSNGYKYSINFNFYGHKTIKVNQTGKIESTPKKSELAIGPKTSRYSYVTTTHDLISLSNIKKGSTVTLLNSNRQTVATKSAISDGTVNFNMDDNSLSMMTPTGFLSVTLPSGYNFVINFNYIGYKPYQKTNSNTASTVTKNNQSQTATSSSVNTKSKAQSSSKTSSSSSANAFSEKSINTPGPEEPGSLTSQNETTYIAVVKETESQGYHKGFPAALQGTWVSKNKQVNSTLMFYGMSYYRQVGYGDPEVMDVTHSKSLGNNVYSIKGFEYLYSNTLMTRTIQVMPNGHLMFNGTEYVHG